ncbi:hypothetical protein GCM10028861_26560 [Flavobacterium koreense]
MAWDLSASHIPAFRSIFYFVAFESLRQQNKRILTPIWAKKVIHFFICTIFANQINNRNQYFFDMIEVTALDS